MSNFLASFCLKTFISFNFLLQILLQMPSRYGQDERNNVTTVFMLRHNKDSNNCKESKPELGNKKMRFYFQYSECALRTQCIDTYSINIYQQYFYFVDVRNKRIKKTEISTSISHHTAYNKINVWCWHFFLWFAGQWQRHSKWK